MFIQASSPYDANNDRNNGWEDKIVRSYVPLQLSNKCGHLHYVNVTKRTLVGGFNIANHCMARIPDGDLLSARMRTVIPRI